MGTATYLSERDSITDRPLGFTLGCEYMVRQSLFDEIIRVFHRSDVIEDSLGTYVDKHIVLMRREAAEEEASILHEWAENARKYDEVISRMVKITLEAVEKIRS